ncbi:unnamed protein product [Phaedon cochleariae]|uniref:Uncharacterized protein n=1 Tax=Phaedon cochleariae TaxID=80249 RepID=A0A9P0GL55_PHACE|nr:unnamed protein product [Phaedon cochleariae]
MSVLGLRPDRPAPESEGVRQDYDDAVVMRTSLNSLFQHSTKNNHPRGNTSRRSSIGADLEESDSQFSYSNSSSPQRKTEDQEDNDDNDDDGKYSPKVQIIAARGDNIIAVANPALAMSPAIIPPLTPIKEVRENSRDRD